MAAEGGGAALLDSSHDTPLLWRQRVREPKQRAVLEEDVGHFQNRTRH
jgi:hypothetical protein